MVTVQAFEADIAGSVSVEFTADELRLGSVSANPGWTWSSSQPGDDELMVVFLSSDGREFRFAAELLPDGTLAAKVDELLVETVQGRPQVLTIRHSVTATTRVSVPPVAASATPSPPGAIRRPDDGAGCSGPSTGQGLW